jgi:leucyl aminopeptidase
LTASLTRELVTEPPNIIYPETFVEARRGSVRALASRSGSGRDEMAQILGALLGVARVGPRAPTAGDEMERRQDGTRRSLLSARA